MTDGPSISHALQYRDAKAAIDFLGDAFGFEQVMVVPGEGEEIAHAELVYGNGMVMLGSVRDEESAARAGRASAYVVVEDVDAHYARAKAAGAEIVMELTDTDYGSRDYAAKDPEGNQWNFGTYRPSLTGEAHQA